MEAPLSVVAAFLAIGIAIIAAEIRRYTFDFLSVFSGAYLLFYSLGPLHVLVGGESFVAEATRGILNAYTIGTGQAILAIVLVYICVRYSYLAAQSYQAPTSSHRNFTIPRSLFTGTALVSLLIGVLSIAIYTTQYGGLISSIAYAGQIRATEEPGGAYVFTKQLIPFVFVSFILSFGLAVERTAFEWEEATVLVSSAIASILAILLLGGRIPALITALVCYLVIALSRGRLYFSILAPLAVVGGFFTVFSNTVFHFATLGPERAYSRLQDMEIVNAYQLIWSEFTGPYLNLEVAMQSPQYTPRGLYDWLVAPLHLIPTALTGMDAPDTVTHLNTWLVSGEWASIFIPGLVASFWYSGEWIGLLIAALVYGAAGGLVDQWLRRFEFTAPMIALYCWAALIWGFQLVRSGDPRIWLRGQIVWIVVFLALGAYWAWRRRMDRSPTKYQTTLQD